MTRRAQERNQRGFFAIGILNPKKSVNVGTLWRTAYIFGASYTFTIGARYSPQHSDTVKSHRHIPLIHYKDFADFYDHLPYDSQLVGLEIVDNARDLFGFTHPQRAVYLLGAEDHGLPQSVLDRCHHVVRLRGEYSLNVSVAGSICLYHRGESYVESSAPFRNQTHAMEMDTAVNAVEPLVLRAV